MRRASTVVPLAENRWRLPELGFLKCNVDGSIDLSTGRAGYTCVLQNNDGAFLHAITCPLFIAYEPSTVVLMGVVEGLSWFKQQGLHSILIETDCLSIVQAVRSSSQDFTYFGTLISHCTALLAELNNVSYLFVWLVDQRIKLFIS